MTPEHCAPRLPEFLHDFGFPTRSRLRSQWTQLNGLRWHTRSSAPAAGTPFILVHGLIISSLYMIPLAECLSKEAEVHAVDLPGFGRSQGPPRAASVAELARALVEWLDSKGIGKCHVVANSLGCQVCATLARRVPHRVATLTLIGPTVDPAAHSIHRQIARLLLDLVRDPPRLLLNQIVDVIRAGPVRGFATVREMFSHRIASDLPHIPVRTLVMRGARDPIAPERWTREAARLLPNGEALTLPAAAHCVHYSHPAETACAIWKFIRSR